MKKALFFVYLTTLMISSVAPGGSLQKEHVRGDAKWLLHVDLDALRSSEIGKLIQNDIQTQHQEKIDAMAQLLGSDLTEDLHAVTLYGASAGEENASALFYGNYNKEKLLTLLVLNEAYSKSEYNGKTLHHWMDEKRQKDQYGVFAADDLIVIAQTEESVIATLDVLSGKVPSLAQQKDATLYSLCQGRDDAIALAAAEELSELAENNQHAATLKNSRLLAALVAEKAGDMKVDIHLEAQNEDAAMQIEQVVRGILAFAMLQNQQYPQFGKLLQSIDLSRDKNALDCTFIYPSAELYEIIKAHADIKAVNEK
ncbi:MAG: hypothetical protein ISS71_01690 [Phycisphaerae bacterium]|nr:hypothetical protein [Phycisphaerae bacterium]